MKIKNRKCELRQIAVSMIGKTLRMIHVTPKQLEKLNAIPIGKEVFLSLHSCQIGGDFQVIRTKCGLVAYLLVTGLASTLRHWHAAELKATGLVAMAATTLDLLLTGCSLALRGRWPPT